nr:tetratricopeptide repeat protein [uncultured Rhodopila sp.]
MTHAKHKYARRPLPLAAAALGALLLAGCAASSGGSAQNDEAARLRLARMAEANGNVSDELALLGPAAARDPNDAALQKQYAAALAKAGRNTEALDIALAQHGRDRNDTDTALLVGRLYVRLDNAPAAVAIYQDVAARAADNLEALNGLGIARVMQRSFPDAEAAFRRAIAVAPDDQASRNNLALALTLEHKTDAAIEILETLQREDNGSRRVRVNLALAYAAAGNRDKAAALLAPIMDQAEVEKTLVSYARLSGDAAEPAPARISSATQAEAGGKTGRPGG